MRDPKRDDLALRPVGAALAAVVAGLGAGKAQAVETPASPALEPASHTTVYFEDPTNHPGFEEDPDLVVGASEPVAPFSGR